VYVNMVLSLCFKHPVELLGYNHLDIHNLNKTRSFKQRNHPVKAELRQSFKLNLLLSLGLVLLVPLDPELMLLLLNLFYFTL